MINSDILKVLMNPGAIEQIARKLQRDPKLKAMYQQAIKDNPALLDDMDELYKVVMGGMQDDTESV